MWKRSLLGLQSLELLAGAARYLCGDNESVRHCDGCLIYPLRIDSFLGGWAVGKARHGRQIAESSPSNWWLGMGEAGHSRLVHDFCVLAQHSRDMVGHNALHQPLQFALIRLFISVSQLKYAKPFSISYAVYNLHSSQLWQPHAKIYASTHTHVRHVMSCRGFGIR